MEALTPTARVILGMIAFGNRTGYDIKQFVDKSTRHFWAASYGQIYPELRRLEEQGLVAGHEEPTGARARTVYELTAAGKRALQAWLTSPVPPAYEVRDEGMLRLFFSDAAPDAADPDELRLQVVRAMRVLHEQKLDALRAVQPHAATGPPGVYMTLQLGLALTERTIEWCRETEARLAPGKTNER